MCHFITATFSGKINLENINNVAENFSLKFQVCDNEYVKKQLQKNEAYINKFSNHCDCGTNIGISTGSKMQTQRFQKSEIDRLKKKGWTQTKINRWLNDKKKNDEKIEQDNANLLNEKSFELENWIGFFQALFSKPDIEYFGLMLHWYSKGLENENIKIIQQRKISYKKLTVIDLKTLVEDNLLCVTK